MGDAIVKWYRSQQYYDSGAWRGTWELDGGGALMNQAIHSVDLLTWLMGPVVEVRAQTAQAKLSGWVIGALPPALLLAMHCIDPDLTAPLFHSVAGAAILAAALALEGMGLFLMRRLAEVEL